MRALTMTLALLTPALALAGWGQVEGDGELQTQVREASGFTGIELEAPLDVFIREGEFSVKITLDGNLQALVKTRVVGDTLEIATEESIRPDRKARIDITLPELRAVAIHASGDVDARGMNAASEVKVTIHGSGNVVFDGRPVRFHTSIHGSGDVTARLEKAVERAEIAIHGSGDVRLAGPGTERLAVSIHGSGDVDVRGLKARNGSYSINGSGNIATELDGGQAQFAVNGSGDIEWSGDAEVRARVVSGSGSIRRVR